MIVSCTHLLIFKVKVGIALFVFTTFYTGVTKFDREMLKSGQD